jgi:hypothetical protein
VNWLTAFGDATSQHDIDTVMCLFLPKAFWRDLVAFTWDKRPEAEIIPIAGFDNVGKRQEREDGK